ncbi:MAG: phosphatidate cytidylyltransferase [Bdellovibrio sp.]|nr:phosphatidate cytidylyltransferase [Bdellovibrio sp.]
MSSSMVTALVSIYSFLALVTSVFGAVRWLKGPGKMINELIERTLSWWVILTVATVCLFINDIAATLSLMMLSFFAFHEIISKYGLPKAHLRVLRISYVAIPLQYLFAYLNMLDVILVFIPVFGFFALSLRSVATGKTEEISKAMGVIHWSLMMTVFTFSHIALIYHHPMSSVTNENKYALVLFLIVTTELNDIFQFTWGKLFGKNKIVPEVSPKKTTEGLLGGLISTTALSYALAGFIGVTEIQAMILGFLISLTGFFGDITFSAVKRDLNIKDLGNSIPGHGGLLDRVDSLALTSVVFFYTLLLMK